VAIAFDNAGITAGVSHSHTIGGGSNRILIVGLSSETTDWTACTYNGVAMTHLQTEVQSEARIELWYMLEAQLPAAGAYTVLGTNASGGRAVGAASYTGVAQTSTFNTVANAQGSGTAPSVAANSAADELVIDVVASKDSSALTANASQAQRYSGLGVDIRQGGSSEAGTGSPVTMSWTATGGAGWAILAVAMRPASGDFPLDAGPGNYLLTGGAVAQAYSGHVYNAYDVFTEDVPAYGDPDDVQNCNPITPKCVGGAFVLSADPGSYAIAGMAAELLVGRFLSADPGTYGITGVDATLIHGLILIADPGSYVITGAAADLTHGAILSADAGSYVITGAAAELLAGRFLSADPGSYAIAGMAAELLAGRFLSADPGAYTITGVAAELIFTPATGAFELNLEPGVYTITGMAATLTAVQGGATEWRVRAIRRNRR
jgi:hypothetical protein